MQSEQTLIARYRIEVPQEFIEPYRSTSWALVDEAGEYIASVVLSKKEKLEAFLNEHANGTFKIEERSKELYGSAATVSREGVDIFLRMARLISPIVEGEDRKERVRFDTFDRSIELRTPTRLGVSEHLRARRTIEHALRELGWKFEVKCMTEHSDAVCRLVDVPVAPPEAAP